MWMLVASCGLRAEVLDAAVQVEWAPQERAQLEAGQSVFRHLVVGEGRSMGVAAVLVGAPPEDVLEQVVDFDAYVTYMPYVTASHTERRWTEGGVERILASYEVTTWGVTTHYEIDNWWNVAEDTIRWVVEAGAGNPVNRGEGWWRAAAWPDGRTLLEYSATFELRWWVPQRVEDKAANRGLPWLVRLIKERAEST